MALSTASDDRAPVAIPGLVATHGRWLLAAILVVGSLYRLWVLSAADIDLFFDEAYYWDWAQQLAWGYYSKPPLLAWLIAATTAVFGDGEIAVKSGALLAYPVTTWILFLLGRRLYNESLAFYVALAFFTLPAVSLSSLVIATDVVLLLVWTAAMLFFHRAISDNRWVDWLIAGALGGVGLLAKYNFVLFLPSALLFLSVSAAHCHHLRNPKLYAAVGLAAAVFLPHILWNAAHGWPTLRHTAEISKLGGDLFHVGHLAEFVGAQFGVFGPLFFAAFLWAVCSGGRRWSDPRWRFLLCFSVPFLATIGVQALLARAHANWAAPTYVAATILVCAWLLEERRRWLQAAIALNIVLGVTFYHWQTIVPALGGTLTEDNDPYHRVRGWEALAAEVDRLRMSERDLPLLADSRREMAALRYYLSPRPSRSVMWHPGGPAPDHYALTVPLTAEQTGPWLYVTRRDDPDEVLTRFRSVTALGVAEVPLSERSTRRVSVWRLDGFRGYR